MANEFVARNGLISQNNSTVTGSLTVTQGITGSLFGTGSVSTKVIITNDLGTSTSHQIIFSPSGSGAVNAKVSNGYLTWTPSSKLLTAGDLTLTNSGNRTLTIQASAVGGTEIKLLPNASSGFARLNVGNTTQPLDFQMNSVDVMRLTQAGFLGLNTTSPNARLDVNGDSIITGSLTVTNSITSSLFGTSSWAQNAQSASYVLQAVSSSLATSASYSVTASYALSTLGGGSTFNQIQRAVFLRI